MNENQIKRSTYEATSHQQEKLDERHSAEPFETHICGMNIVVHPGVYQMSGDSELMVDSVEISKDQNFLEIGCGTGVVSIAVAKRAGQGIGVDINEKAVENSRRNAERQHVKNVEFIVSNMFENVKGSFDVVITNPPYSNHEVRDDIDRMFWDPGDEMKRRFFKEVGNFLKPHGRIYFGWANFADIDIDLPFKLAKENGYKLKKTFSKPHKNQFTYYVFEFGRK